MHHLTFWQADNERGTVKYTTNLPLSHIFLLDRLKKKKKLLPCCYRSQCCWLGKEHGHLIQYRFNSELAADRS